MTTKKFLWISFTAVAGFIAGVLIGSSALAAEKQNVYQATYSDDGNGSRILIKKDKSQSSWLLKTDEIFEDAYPQYIAEHQPVGPERIVTLRSVSRQLIQKELLNRGVIADKGSPEKFIDEVITIVDSGPSSNRIDLVFMGDGYTEQERDKFFDDIRRMVSDMFTGDTFASYLPLFNVHAVFRASRESGIGKNDRAKDTAYRLYRAGNTLRAIYPGDKSALRNSCSQAPGCDYPIVIGNDPYYGGLGGEFAVSTSSPTSGTVVLRHELGHNFGRVGEEYDGGGYFGANHSRSLNSLTWKHWANESTVRAEPVVSRFIAWPWKNLDSGDFSAKFRSNGQYSKAIVTYSASGLNGEDALNITLDGAPITYENPGTDDRRFQTIAFDSGFSDGSHELKFSKNQSDTNNWFSSVNVQEYKEGYNFDNEYIGAYPVFGQSGAVDGYRSNHFKCLMRNMRSEHFCSICQENNWLKFFARVNVIDDIEVNNGSKNTTVNLKAMKLGQFRTDGLENPGSLSVSWYRNNTLVPDLQDQVTWTLPTRDIRGDWRVDVEYKTPEVRKDTRGLLKGTKEIEI